LPSPLEEHRHALAFVETVFGGGPGKPKTRALNRARKANPQRLHDGAREYAEREAEFKRLKKQRRPSPYIDYGESYLRRFDKMLRVLGGG
jgi:hypothetical protein